jgi:hypothetical protein
VNPRGQTRTVVPCLVPGIAALGDLNRLRELLDRVLDVASWDELLAPPGQSA